LLCVGIQQWMDVSMDVVGAKAYTGRRADSTPQSAGLISAPKPPSLGLLTCTS
jgi:hypothetical protein